MDDKVIMPGPLRLCCVGGICDRHKSQGPWIPDPEELEEFKRDLDVALSSDFRLMVHQHAKIEEIDG